MSKYSSLLQQTKQESLPISKETTDQEDAKTKHAEQPLKNTADTSVAPIKETTKEVPAAVAADSPAPVSKVLNMEPPRGKKGHPDYNQVTIYLKKQTQNKAKIAMLQAQDHRDFSELVEDLLTDWLAGQSR